MQSNEIFHVHTYRCGHAEMISDEAYIKKAIEKKAVRITFTDHAPFPNNPFGNRMDILELPEYISSLKELKAKYEGIIEVRIGLEAEYLPSYLDYYKELYSNSDIDILIIGQHFYEIEPGVYSFSDTAYQKREHIGCMQATLEGINSGLFQVVAHPDRVFRRITHWDKECEQISKEVIEAAKRNHVLLEQNFASIRRRNCYWDEFWNMVDDELIIQGYDAHSLKDLDKAIEIKKSITNSMLEEEDIFPTGMKL